MERASGPREADEVRSLDVRPGGLSPLRTTAVVSPDISRARCVLLRRGQQAPALPRNKLRFPTVGNPGVGRAQRQECEDESHSTASKGQAQRASVSQRRVRARWLGRRRSRPSVGPWMAE